MFNIKSREIVGLPQQKATTPRRNARNSMGIFPQLGMVNRCPVELSDLFGKPPGKNVF
jgi:hypothetical protein